MHSEHTNGPASAAEAAAALGPGSRQPVEDEGDDDDAVAEADPSRRYCRYQNEVGKGRFKKVFKGFDERRGIDVAWSKLSQESLDLNNAQLAAVAQEMRKGLDLDHPNIIKCYLTWQDGQAHCINLITEFFTSGNLREYRQRHKHLELKAVKKWARQILSGLDYLHTKEPPVVHGDLRCDKIYINGHSGEIKIGDLGLATLLPRRFPAGQNGSGAPPQYTRETDVFAFGLIILELATKRKLEAGHCEQWPQLLEALQDPQCKALIHRCLGPAEERPSAQELMNDSFFLRRLGKGDSAKSMVAMLPAAAPPLTPRSSHRSETEGSDSAIHCQVGTVRGEDWNFQFSGKIVDGVLHFRLQMQYEGDESEQVGTKRTVEFSYDDSVDTPDTVAVEISNEFALSETDRDICAAALKEWLAKEASGHSD